MSKIRSTNTIPELTVRKYLHSKGYRYRLHDSKLPGKPDIVLRKHNLIIQVHGCFWHRHKGCKYAYSPKSRQHFWENKFKQNIERDKKVTHKLNLLGWNLITVWECETDSNKKIENKLGQYLTC